MNRITLTEYNGYFAAEETLINLKPGTYEFSVTNEAGKTVGFQLQDRKNNEDLQAFVLEVGESKRFSADVGEAGVRYRCPLNPTPWVDVEVSA